MLLSKHEHRYLDFHDTWAFVSDVFFVHIAIELIRFKATRSCRLASLSTTSIKLQMNYSRTTTPTKNVKTRSSWPTNPVTKLITLLQLSHLRPRCAGMTALSVSVASPAICTPLRALCWRQCARFALRGQRAGSSLQSEPTTHRKTTFPKLLTPVKVQWYEPRGWHLQLTCLPNDPHGSSSKASMNSRS